MIIITDHQSIGNLLCNYINAISDIAAIFRIVNSLYLNTDTRPVRLVWRIMYSLYENFNTKQVVYWYRNISKKAKLVTDITLEQKTMGTVLVVYNLIVVYKTGWICKVGIEFHNI